MAARSFSTTVFRTPTVAGASPAAIRCLTPTLADVLAQVPPTGDQWRVENIGYNPLAGIPVQNVALDVVNSVVVDYTVQLTDKDGTFYVWARNLDRALQLQAKDGNARGFNLRNYQLNFADLQQQINSTDDSTYTTFSTELSSLGSQRDALATTIKDELYNAEFNGVALPSSATNDLSQCNAIVAEAARVQALDSTEARARLPLARS